MLSNLGDDFPGSSGEQKEKNQSDCQLYSLFGAHIKEIFFSTLNFYIILKSIAQILRC